MGTAFSVIATLICLLGLLATLSHVGYLAMLRRAARGRGATGGTTLAFVDGRWKQAGAATAVAAAGLLLTAGPTVADVAGLVLAGGAGLYATRALEGTRREFRSPR